MRILLAIFLICPLILPLDLLAQNPGKEAYDSALRLRREGNYKDAVKLFTSAMEHTDGDVLEIRIQRGYTFYYLKDYGSAVEDFKVWASVAPKDADAHIALGKALMKVPAPIEAISSFNEAIELDPENATALNDRGMVKSSLKQFAGALDDFESAILHRPDFASAYNNAGAARFFNQDIDNPIESDIIAARNLFSQAIEADPTLAIAYRNRGAMHLFLESFGNATEDFRVAARLTPDDPVAFFYAGVAYARKGEPNLGIDFLEQTLEVKPTFFYALEAQADIRKQQNRFDDAIELYKEAKRAAPDHQTVFKGLMDYKIAVIHAHKKDKTEMFSRLKSAKKLGAFSDKAVYKKFLSQREFRSYRSNKKFRRFTKSLSKLKKEYKFLKSELRWFRMLSD